MLWVLIRISLASTHNIYFHGARRIILVLFVLEKVHCLKLRVCYNTKLRCWIVTNKYHLYFLSRKEKVREKTQKFTELLQSADCKVGVITSKKLEGHIALGQFIHLAEGISSTVSVCLNGIYSISNLKYSLTWLKFLLCCYFLATFVQVC